MFRIIVLTALASLAVACALPSTATTLPVVSVEVNQASNEFRISIHGDPSVSIIRWQLSAPSKSLPPRSAAVLARTSDGRIVGCGRENRPRRAANSFSSSTPTSQVTFGRLPPDGQFISPWFRVDDLFFLFDNCVLPSNRGRYVEYRIIVDLDTSRGVVHAETHWLPIVGFDPGGTALEQRVQ